MLKITIPTPCHEDWNKMTPDETGRHCGVCAKSVVDFTGMSDDEVKHFFLNKKEDKRVCGRFKQTQLQNIVIELPRHIFSIQMPLWKKFLAACLIVFSTTLFSCETKIKGKAPAQYETEFTGVKLTEPDTVPVIAAKEVPTIKELSEMSGGMGIVYVQTDPLPFLKLAPDTTIQKSTRTTDSGDLKGEIDIIPAKDTTTEKAISNDHTRSEELILSAIALPIIYEKRNKAKQQTDSSKTKNPPKADSINCNTIKNYY